MDKAANDRFMRFLFVIRQVCLMIAAWVEGETNTKQKGMSEMRSTTDPAEAPLQFRKLSEAEIDAIADQVMKKVAARSAERSKIEY